MQACDLILLPSSISPSLFIYLFLPFLTILNHPEDMNTQGEYTAGYFGGFNYPWFVVEGTEKRS